MPLTCSVSSRTAAGSPRPGLASAPPLVLRGLQGPPRVWGGRHSLGYRPFNTRADIGHVDFLEKVHGLAERPYVIAGLHFDQVLPGWRAAWRPRRGSRARGGAGAASRGGPRLAAARQGTAGGRATPTHGAAC